jgi:hypothetical protein
MTWHHVRPRTRVAWVWLAPRARARVHRCLPPTGQAPSESEPGGTVWALTLELTPCLTVRALLERI